MRKRSQAALEFLTTYGWAFLVILIMIGALAYFGILSPGKVLSDRCNFGAEFTCIDYQISAGATPPVAPDPQVKIQLKNNAGNLIDVDSTAVASESAVALTCTAPTIAAGWKSGEIKNLAWTACSSFGGLIKEERGKVLVTIKYHVTGNIGYSKEVKGEIFATVVGT